MIIKFSEEGKVIDKIVCLYVGLILWELVSYGDGLINFCWGIYYWIKWYWVCYWVLYIILV